MPEGILDFFELVWAESQSLDSRESKKDILYTGTLHMYLDERNNRTDQMQDLRIVSHGTLQVCRYYRFIDGEIEIMGHAKKRVGNSSISWWFGGLLGRGKINGNTFYIQGQRMASINLEYHYLTFYKN